jgi:GTPase SAR1 family protein
MEEIQIVQFLDILGFKQTEDLASLRISVGSVIENTEEILNSDSRYFFDEQSLGIHISNEDFAEGDWQVIEKIIQDERLSVLYISNAPFKVLKLGQNSGKLEFLNLSRNELLHKVELNNIMSLKEFICSYCVELEEVSLVGKFTKLSKLDISYNNVLRFRLPNSLPNLFYLNFSYNEIREINLAGISEIKYLFGSSNKIETLEFKRKIKNLSILDLSKNRELDFQTEAIISAQNSLESLNLSNTATTLESLKPIRDFSILSQVELQNTPIDKEYPADVKQGWDAVKRLLIDKLVAFNHVKVLLLGNTNVGKSDLIHYLKTNKQRQESPSTHGLEYHQLVYPKGTRKEENKIYLHCWDFGGQEYYHGTHKLFFSGGSVNLLLWLSKNEYRFDIEEQCFELDYWLRCIEQLSFDSTYEIKTKTLVIENKIDRNQSEFTPTPLNQVNYQDKYGQKMDLDYVSMALKPAGNAQLAPFKYEIFESHFQDIIKQSIQRRPVEDVRIFDRIKSFAQQKPVVKVNEILPDNSQITILEVFHFMGIILYFKEITPNIVFIKPQEFLSFLYRDILKDKGVHTINKDEIKGIIYHSSFRSLLDEGQVLKILIAFDLVFKIEAESPIFFIPQYLPDKGDVSALTDSYFKTFASAIIESDSYLMNLVMLKIYGRFGSLVSESGGNYLFWKDGLVIGKPQQVELKIVFHRAKQQIEIFENKESTDIALLENLIGFITQIPEDYIMGVEIKNVSYDKDGSEIVTIHKDFQYPQPKWDSNYFQVYLSIEAERKVAYKSLKEARELNIQHCTCTNGNRIDVSLFERFFKIKKMGDLKIFNKGPVYDELITALKNKNVVIFVGAGVSAYTTNGDKLSMWTGLLEHGINYCCEVAHFTPEWKKRQMDQLNGDDVDEWLSVAELLSKKLKAVRQFKTWLSNSVGTLSNVKPNLIQQIGELNTQIYTTNYDNLLDLNLNRKIISNRDVDKIQEVLSGSRNEIVHLHGFYDDPKTIILGNVSYNDLSHNKFFQTIQQSIFNVKHILFVGFGAGLGDPNFGPLLEWTKSFASSEHHHYRLVKEEEKTTLPPDPKIQNLVYGEEYDDLLPFFEELVNDVKTP